MTNKKSNNALRAALVLCVLALFCAAFVGYTFAKYVTADDAADTARVAKWGISVSVGGTLFGNDYTANSAEANKDMVSAATSTNVHAGTDIVAPGTEADKGIIIKLSGTPEVQYDVSAVNKGTVEDIFLGAGDWGTMVVAVGVTEDNYTPATYYTTDDLVNFTLEDVDETYNSTKVYYELHDKVSLGAAYYPLSWTLTDAVNGAQKTSYDNRSESNLAALNTELLVQLAAEGDANVKLDVNYIVKWAWAFDGQNDVADTILGNLMAADNNAVVVIAGEDGTSYGAATDGTDYNLDVAFDVAVTVEQVD